VNLIKLKKFIETIDKQDLKGIAHLYHQIGYIFEQKQDFIDALNYYKQSLNIELSYLPSNDHSLSATYNNIGAILYEQGDFNRALDNYRCALDIDKLAELPNHMQIATSYNNIGLIFMYQEKYQEALEIINKQWKLYTLIFHLVIHY
jgi:tetratricopeptide (TPR) repeat protein